MSTPNGKPLDDLDHHGQLLVGLPACLPDSRFDWKRQYRWHLATDTAAGCRSYGPQIRWIHCSPFSNSSVDVWAWIWSSQCNSGGSTVGRSSFASIRTRQSIFGVRPVKALISQVPRSLGVTPEIDFAGRNRVPPTRSSGRQLSMFSLADDSGGTQSFGGEIKDLRASWQDFHAICGEDCYRGHGVDFGKPKRFYGM